MANKVNQWGNPKAKEIYDKYMSGDNKDKAYIPERDYYSPEKTERRKQAQDMINSTPKDTLSIPETQTFKEQHPDITMDEYLSVMSPDKIAAMPGPKATNLSVETLGTTVPQNTQSNTNSESGASANSNDWTIKVWEQNANLNYYQYWDDSNPAQQWQKGWMNPKYTGEWVSNSYIEYNPDLTVADLDPNYLYWENARQQNRQESGYIARRNDQIASALYNEWLTSRWDVANYLNSQNWFTNSTEADRENTIESIYKRLWQIQPTEEVQPDLSKADEIVQDTSWTIYWKTTADSGNPEEGINTLADANSVFRAAEQQRADELKSAVSLSSEKLWYLIADWANIFSEQTMRDMQQFYPEKYQEIQNEVKKIQAQDNINSISFDGTMDVSSHLAAWENNVTTSMNAFVNKTASWSWAWTLATNLNNALAESEIVNWAREQMEVYKRKIVDIQQSIDELPSLANQYFKWDVPDYMVNAFINNRTQQYNKELQKYQNLYNASLDEAKWEVSQTQWREEMNYKWGSLQADINYKNANLELNKQELAYNMQKASITNWQWNDDGSYSYVDLEGNMHTLSAEEAKKAMNQDLYNKSTAFIDYWKNIIDEAKANWATAKWWQCEAMSDNYARQNFGTEMKKENWSAWATTVDEKARYATEALPQRWYIAVFDFWIKDANWTNRWHTWIVIDYDPVTWDFTTLESNVDWQWTVAIKTRNINSHNLIWFRDPTQAEPRNWWKSSTAADSYLNLPNWMLDVFLSAESHSDTWEERKYVKQWREWYGIINGMLKNWEVEAILSGDEIWQGLSNTTEGFKKYILENASNRTMTDEDGNAFIDTMLQMFLNSWEIVDPKERDALQHLTRLVEIKLRRDSWAAINIWEWLKNYDMYMPQIWLSRKQKMQRLFDLERAAVEAVLPWEDVVNYVPLITEEMVQSQSDETVQEKRNEETGNAWLNRKKSENK